MAMIATLFAVKNTSIKFSYLCTAAVGLAILSSGAAWLAILLAFGFCFHLWQAFERNNWSMIITSSMAGLLFVVLFSAHLLLEVPLFWVVLAILLLAIVGFLNDESAEIEVVIEPEPEGDAFIEESPLSVFADRKQLRQGYYAWCDNKQISAALIVIRLEGFEQVNQHIGRDFGDILLAQSANRIKELLSSDEIVTLTGQEKLAHLGGLNFAFICSFANQKHLHELVIDQILGATLKPFNVANCTVEVKARASYVDCNEQDNNFDNLISYAYLALDSHPDRKVVPYHQQMMIELREQQARLKELANIDFSSELELYFQPIICNENGQIEFLELLLRWQHPKQGILSANRFIDDIRIAGLGYPLAKFVIERAAELAMALRIEGISIPLSINVFGPEMLNEEFIEFVDVVLSEHHLEAGDLIVECPLHIFTGLDDKGRGMIARLNNIGLKVCVDGLGDNPVLLSKLPSLAVEYIKVSPSLTADFSNQNNIRSLVSGMVEMHNQQKTKVIFEGVETLEQLKFVKSLKGYAAQGYYFGHPLSSIGLMSWLKEWRLVQQR
ncbi:MULTISPECIES: GGDEF domain-containing phosphodiesterase [Pseudoalteromonas]|jgi:EAL domain-containing protein (putative c-di-GMP-specific phosphodiesterase class I)/GGDEF domain-containing protein|uniref:EAL domain-containing protein n=1 Tax=Pseudoalteromonas TaxID=53246 RepID=UPI0004639DF9|nr:MULTISPECIES: GGDEF domain-containing phosphodiesterase [Pseudoalteromonas]MBB1330980.1 EAL domain-containing protein [Pseudoalteromonas sp. SR43-7]MBB1337203.1 EAL domain-containing protein [Pseudoalteromonas sp. SR44-2]MBB1378254.1 EAL domain-containing protein [Pseudoalteromonas sp. SR43-2]MBD0410745.1 EAL domain-containing protein [Pseudoalteromonas distincta]TVU71512.1 EAL domain-containing protein [Pseudoalteromonas elyakovii]|tara:strand:- start:2011 stop:3675 length:1665 start_codon:yes stop_codon:yes gene_type:complete